MLDELGVTQVTVPLPFRLNHVNCFLAEGDNGWIIIDTGLHDDVARKSWAPYIEKVPISTILLTHHHPDHYGYAGSLQQQTNAEVWITETEDVAGRTFWESDSLNNLKQKVLTCGVPNELSRPPAAQGASPFSGIKPYPTANRYLQEGMKLVFGKYEYEVLLTPGHADGLICLFNKEQRVLFSTDHILERITPNISYWFRGINNPLLAYMDSLKKLETYEADYVIPSHGQPFRNANKRIYELIEHHQDQLEKVYQYIKQPQTIYQVTRQLFTKAVSSQDAQMAMGETLAHLEYLYYNNQCKKSLEGGVWYYWAV
ncbi:MBL fold metallo-hydrolase [Bacillus rubiinfantis]|uniref:MBL fold metallo-hydrolase n=1 Tax=Bacillus rubiinfantis TaxID=1499680 RepID=UPI0005A89CDD|nr:MBL fold metallo-hydrolase [Bacillus rubiinfantis]